MADLQGPETYGFPHPPYPSQLDFMAKVYETLEMGGDADGWAEPLRAQARASAEYVWKRRRERRELRQRRARQSMALTASGAATVPRPMKQRRTADVEQSSRDEAEEGDLSLEAPLQLETVKVPEKAQEDLFAEKLQIIFCSRTHSQLAQVLREIRGIPSSAVPENLAVVTLGSRQSLCIHSVVRSRAKGAGHFNDLCRLATEEGATRSLRCEWKKSAEVMADAFLSEMMDIEGMTERGRAPVGGGCPYYGGRRAVQEADVLLVPYQSLVNKETREKLNLRTEGNVLIFDEAHNLLEAIGDANSVCLQLQQAKAVVEDLETYASCYEARLSPMNCLQLRQLRRLAVQLHHFLGDLQKPSAWTVGGFLVALGADHFDLCSLASFLHRTELPRKNLRSLWRAVAISYHLLPSGKLLVKKMLENLNRLRQLPGVDAIDTHTNYADGQFQGRIPKEAFIVATATDGALERIVHEVEKAELRHEQGRGREPPGRKTLHLVLAHPVDQLKSLTFVKTNMQNHPDLPKEVELTFGAFNPQLGQKLPPIRNLCEQKRPLLQMMSQDRIISEARTVGSDASVRYLSLNAEARFKEALMGARAVLFAGGTLEPKERGLLGGQREGLARKDNRNERMVTELREILTQSAAATAGGMVVFFPSYEYLAQVREQKRGSEDPNLLQHFAAAVREEGMAVLLALSGGRLSEGIDFKDDLCRLVAVVGLPYPNASDLAMVEKPLGPGER
eukprot:g15526.t1